MERTDKYTGKPVPDTAQVGEHQEGTCDHCGGHNIISACPRCGAPVCCKDCCEKDWKEFVAAETIGEEKRRLEQYKHFLDLAEDAAIAGRFFTDMLVKQGWSEEEAQKELDRCN